MKVTYDPSVHAMYVYFADTWNGHSESLPSQIAEFDFDDTGQINNVRVYQHADDGSTHFFGDKLKFALQNPQIRYEHDYLSIELAGTNAKTTVTWECNVDLDADNQIAGLEILFSPLGRLPDRGLDHILKWEAQ